MFWFLSENFSVSCFYLNKIPRRFIATKINLFTRIITFKQANWKISAATPAKQTLISWNYKLD